MFSSPKLDRIAIVVIASAILITALFMNGERFGLEIIHDDDAGRNSSNYFTENDRNSDWDSSRATQIVFSGAEIQIHGTGAYVHGNDVVISATGAYVISGELEGGSIVVNAHKTAKIWILLNGVTITREDDACLRVERADKVFLTLSKGSNNTFTSGKVLSPEADAQGIRGAIDSRDNLTINGTGSLCVNSDFGHGVFSREKLVIVGSRLTVHALKDAIHVSERVLVADAVLSLFAGDDGIDVKGKDGDKNDAPRVYIESGTIDIHAGDRDVEEGWQDTESLPSARDSWKALSDLNKEAKCLLAASVLTILAAIGFVVRYSRRKT